MNGSNGRLAGVTLLNLLSVACWMQGPSATPDSQLQAGAGSAQTDDAGAVIAVAEPVRDEHAIIQARMSIGANSKGADAFVDLDVQGPRTKATAICQALLQAEKLKLPTASEPLVVTVVRPCSGEAMAEPQASTRWALVQVQHLDSVELMLRIPDTSKEEVQAISVRRRFLSGHRDEATCQESLARVREAEAKATQQAQQAAKKWLEQALNDQQKAESKACKTSAKAKGCEQARLLVRMLKDRQMRNETEPSMTPSNRTSVCRLR